MFILSWRFNLFSLTPGSSFFIGKAEGHPLTPAYSDETTLRLVRISLELNAALKADITSIQAFMANMWCLG